MANFIRQFECEDPSPRPPELGVSLGNERSGLIAINSVIQGIGNKGYIAGTLSQTVIIKDLLIVQTKIIDGRNTAVFINISNSPLPLTINVNITFTGDGTCFIARIYLYELYSRALLGCVSQLVVSASTSINGGATFMPTLIVLPTRGEMVFGYETLACSDICNCKPTVTSDVCIGVAIKGYISL